MQKQILIVSHSGDLHADLVASILAARGHAPWRIDLDAFPRDYQLCQRLLDGQSSARLRRLPDGDWLDLRQVGAVWLRKAAEYAYASGDLTQQERAYARLETEQAIFSVLYTLDCYWLSHPLALRGAQWKGEQLERAARMGFRVPATLISNVPDDVRAFRAAVGGPIIFKSMSTPTLAAETVEDADRVSGGIGTTVVDDAMLDSLDAVSELSCQFQEYIAKQYELRITVIGQKLFAARLYSQDDARTAVDSRDMSAPIRYEAATLPDDIHERCLAFVHSYGLEYGALDLIVTPEGEYVFLENNPVGQFLYVQQLVPALPLLESVADKLIEGALCHSQT
jgi:glutathione synthase/RimK-type ligase-like ATP-grasp enzyme